MALVPTLGGSGRFLWALDRFANTIGVIDTTSETPFATLSLAGPVSSDPAPDLVELAPGGAFAFVSLRGPCPLTANFAAVNNAVGSTPGVGVVVVRSGGAGGEFVGVAPVTEPAPANFDCPTRTDDAPGAISNRADPHGLAVRLK